MTRRTEAILILLIMLVALGVRLHFFQSTHNLLSAENEGYSKIHLMLQWDESPLPYPDTNFGPLHTLLLWVPYKLTGSAVLPNRIMTLLFSLLIFLPVYRLVRRRFDPPEALGAMALIAGLFPLSVAGTVTLAETPFVFFTMMGLDLIDEVTLRPSSKWGRLILASLAFNAAGALRFEVWALLPIVALYVLIKRGWKEGVPFGASLLIFPLIHMYFCWKIIGHPLSFLFVSADVTALYTSLKSPQLRAVMLLLSLNRTIGWPGLVVAIAGAIWSLHMRRLVLPILCLLVTLAVLEYKSIQATIELDLLRYLSLSVTLFAMFAGIAVAALVRWRSRNVGLQTAAVLVVSLTAMIFSQANASRELSLLRPTREVFNLLEKLRPELRPDDRVLLGSEYHPVIVVESGLGYLHFHRAWYEENGHVDPAEIERIFTEWKPTAILADSREPFFTQDLAMPREGEVELYGRRYQFIWKQKYWEFWRFTEATP